MNSPCCTWGCDGSKGCLGGHDQLVWPELDPIDPPVVMRFDDEFDDDDNQPWSALNRAESAVIWTIVGLCSLLVFYMAFLAWQQFN